LPKKSETLEQRVDRLAKKVAELESSRRAGFVAYSPSFGPIGWRGPWGGPPRGWVEMGPVWQQANPPRGWVEMGPVWQQANPPQTPQVVFTPREVLVDFGLSRLTSQLAADLAKINARVLRGSELDARWRIAVPKEKLKEARQLLLKANVSYITRASSRRSTE